MGTDSNIADDRSVTNDSTDLSRGSLGAKDAFIGPIELDVTGNYSVVVSSTRADPQRPETVHRSSCPESFGSFGTFGRHKPRF